MTSWRVSGDGRRVWIRSEFARVLRRRLEISSGTSRSRVVRGANGRILYCEYQRLGHCPFLSSPKDTHAGATFHGHQSSGFGA